MDEPPLLAHAASRDVNRMVIRPARMRIGGTPLVAITINVIARCNRPETGAPGGRGRSEEHTSELQSLMRNSYAVCCLEKKKNKKNTKCNLARRRQQVVNTTTK